MASNAEKIFESKEAKKIDPRHPIYLGDWDRSLPHKNDGMAMDDLDEPHIKRKHAIMAAHPSVTDLYGIATSTKYITAALAALQIVVSYFFGRVLTNEMLDSYGLPRQAYHVLYALAVFFIGGSVTATMGSIIHETAHCLAFKSVFLNRCLGLVANIPIPFPIAQSFRRYHLDHHAYQGVVDRDPDLPLNWEISLIRGNSLTKFLWISLYPLMYVVRGMAHQKKPNKWELINVAFTICVDILVYHFCGPLGLFYLFCSLWMGYSFHPGAAHFIQEHYTYVSGQETYSYYGWMNSWMLNVGYHNEHHDFTKIPWTNLPKLKSLAPEYYDQLHSHSSWPGVTLSFIFDNTLAPLSRLARTSEDHNRGRKMVPGLVGAFKGEKDTIVSDEKWEGEDEMERVEKEALEKFGLRHREKKKDSKVFLTGLN
jgi:sphingolipid delta-4 desaturase